MDSKVTHELPPVPVNCSPVVPGSKPTNFSRTIDSEKACNLASVSLSHSLPAILLAQEPDRWHSRLCLPAIQKEPYPQLRSPHNHDLPAVWGSRVPVGDMSICIPGDLERVLFSAPASPVAVSGSLAHWGIWRETYLSVPPEPSMQTSVFVAEPETVMKLSFSHSQPSSKDTLAYPRSLSLTIDLARSTPICMHTWQ